MHHYDILFKRYEMQIDICVDQNMKWFSIAVKYFYNFYFTFYNNIDNTGHFYVSRNNQEKYRVKSDG